MTTVDNKNVGTHDLAPTKNRAVEKFTKAPTASLMAIITLILTGTAVFEVEISYTLTVAGVLVTASIVSAVWPRWAGSRGIFFRHPALFTGYLVTILVAAAPLVNLHPTDQQAGIIITGLMAIVGLAFPRDGYPAWWIRLFGETAEETADDDIADAIATMNELDRERIDG